MIRAVVLDVDDTLCLTEAACFELENEVLAGIGAAPMAREVHLATWGMPLLEAVPLRSPGADLAAFSAALPAVMRAYIEAGRLDVIAPENLATIDRLRAAGRAVMILTSRTGEEVEHMMAADHVLAGRVDAVFHTGNTRYTKPDPRVFDEMLTMTGLLPTQCVYVGDSLGDARAARGAGLHFIACLQSAVRTREDFAGYDVTDFIEAFPDLAGWVEGLEAPR